MKLRRRFITSLKPLLAHRVRTALALAGVAVGVAAVVVARAIGAGAQQEMLRTLQQMGTNLLIIKPLPVKRLVARREIRGVATTLTPEDYDALAALPLIAHAVPAIEGSVRVKAGTFAMRTTVRGTTAAYPHVRNFRLAAGCFFDADDDRAARRVAVIGARVNDELAPAGSLLGQEIRVRGVAYEVIGILEAKGATADGADEDNQVLVPLRTALRRVFNVTWLTTVYTSVTEPARMSEAAANIERVLRARHQRGSDAPTDDFAVQNTAKTRAFQQQMTETLSRYAAGLAAIALLVGGIGIMALMMLSVRERTSEIGLRMAVGALPRDILLQFLLEATVLALAGWAGGLVLGGAAALTVKLGTTWPIAVPGSAIAASFAMAAFIGLGFGAVPARNAARIPPIQALQSA
jgi:putative ABC transport system permease protein